MRSPRLRLMIAIIILDSLSRTVMAGGPAAAARRPAPPSARPAAGPVAGR